MPSRSTDVARQVLGDYEGVVICDGYKAYDVLAREREGLALLRWRVPSRRGSVPSAGGRILGKQVADDPAPATFADDLADQKVLDAVRRSAAERRWVEIAPGA